MRLHRQRGIEQQCALCRPMLQIAVMGGQGNTEVIRYLLKNIYQRGRRRNTLLHGERKPVRLTRPVVRVLAEDNHFYVVQLACRQKR